ncbi:MAG: Uma2 family endonuclease [Anaerolineae bacterium]|nr:Uma2 family endonuclease [Anaerolineae bacterium]
MSLLEHQQPTQPPDVRMSFEEYLRAYDSFEGGRSEWLAGAVAIYPMTNNTRHQQLLQFLSQLLDYFLDDRGLGIVLLAGVPMFVGEDRPAREPDVMVVLNEHRERVLAAYVNGIADIAVEIVSPESVTRDRADKLTEYESLGIPEYWLIDPLRTDATFYALGDDNLYHPIPLDARGYLTSRVLPGFALDPALLWADEYPRGAALARLIDAMG